MKILLCHTEADEVYLDRFQRLPALHGHKIVRTKTVYVNPVTLDVICEKNQIDAVICCQQPTLHGILRDTPDWLAPSGTKKITLDDYAGSLLSLRSGREVVVINPLERLRTVPHEKFILDRYISKISKKSSWLKETEFKWQVVTYENRASILAKIETASLCAIDIENPHPQNSLRTITCVSYTVYNVEKHTTESFAIPFDETWHWEFIKAANDTSSRKVFQNGLHDNTYFMRWGAPVRNWLYDTFHLFHSWQSELPKRLDFVSAFAVRKIRFWKDDGKTGNFHDLLRYCALDGWATINALLGILHVCPDYALTNYIDHEFLMVYPCLTAAMEGLDCDVERFREISVKKEKEVESLLSRIQFILGESNYNPGSWQQNEKLFQLLGCGDLGGTGKIPTLKAKALHPLNNAILSLVEDYKQGAKQVSTYFNSKQLWHGRIYYSINPGGTDTLRAASSQSSFDCGWQIQNIPRDDPAFKECVLAPDGWYIGEADKKQSEARCVAYLSGDLALLYLVESSHDYHAWNAAKFFGIDYARIYDEISGRTLDKPIRDLSKRTNHGANYNMGAGVMLDTMGPLRVAQAKITLKLPKIFGLKAVCWYLLDKYNATYPSVKGRWYESIIQEIEMTKKLVSPLGWVRYFHGSPRENKQNLNSAVAHAPQNLSVDIINREWYKIWHDTIYGDLRGHVRIKAQIHDSLLFIYKEVKYAMEVATRMDLRVQVKCSAGITRTMYIPSDLSIGKTVTRRWSDLK